MNEAVNMADFIEAKSDQLNADDLLDRPRTITVTGVSANPESGEQPVSIHYEGENGRPFKPCKTMRRLIIGVWGADTSNYIGRSMTLYRDADVQFGGMKVGGIRISHMSHIDKEQIVPLMVTRGRKRPFKVLPLAKSAPPADKTDKVADGVRALIERIEAGEDITADAAAAKQIAWLEDKRPELAEQIRAALAKLEGDNPFDEQEGDAGTQEETESASPSDEWKARVDECKTLSALGKVESDFLKERDDMDEAAADAIDLAIEQMRKALKAQK